MLGGLFSRSRRFVAGLSAAALSATLLAGAPPGTAAAAPTYRNPVDRSFADTFADPAVILAKDGWWYAYSTADPLKAGDPPGIMHIARTRDFVDWDYRGTVFTEANRPAYATPTAGLWAPDVRYVGGRYVMYYTVTDTTVSASGGDSAIGIATSPSPTGPWTPGAAPVVAPRPGNGDYLWTFDPAMFTDVNGQKYLYYGSYNGGVYGTRLSADGLRAVGTPTQVAIDNRYEGSYVVRRGDWYYYMASSANCCAGPTTGYSVFAGRSRSPLGPFVDADGISLTASRVGGTIVLTQNGNRWIGAGHHAIATDATGRDFIVYHALDRNKPWLTEPFGINRRPMLIDRLDWVNGWPRTRAGRGPSDSPQSAPVTTSGLGIVAADPARRGFRGLRQGPADAQAGATARVQGSARTVADASANRVRVRFDVRGNQPLTVTLGKRRDRVAVTLNPGRSALTVTTTADGRRRTVTDRVRTPGARWRTVVVEVDRSRVLAWVGESDLNDPAAEVRLNRPGLDLAAAPVRFRSGGALIDNLTVRGLAREARRLAPVPQTGRLLASEEFSDATLDGWTEVRDPNVTVSGGQLNWPVEGKDLVGAGNNAGILLQTPPAGRDRWIAETKVTLDLGETDVRNFQQAGIIAHRSDDDFARLSSVAIWNTRQTEFGRETDATPDDDADDRTIYGGAVVGTPSATTYLRLAYTRTASGEHRYRAGTSRDGARWTWGAVWTFTPGTQPRIGLVAHGGAEPPVTAEFDYLRWYATR